MSPAISLLKLARFFRILGLVNFVLLVVSIRTIRRTSPVPRGCVCPGGCACIPWTLIIVGVLSGLDVLKKIVEVILLENKNQTAVLPWLVFIISAVNAVLLFVLGWSWIRAK